MVTLEELKKAGLADLPLTIRTEAFFAGTKALSEFARQVMVPVLTGQVGLSDKENALVGIYVRMCGWIYSLVAMNSLRHIQGVAAATRSLFELLLDLNILARDTTDELVERFHNFVEVKRFDTAKKTVNFNNANPSLVNYDDSPQRTLLNTPGKEAHVKNLLLKHWPGHKKCPDHWTGEDTRKRAVGLGPQFEELYVRTYSVLSWYVHPGSVCYAGMDANALENGFGWYHSLSQEFFLNATSVCGRQMKVDVAVGVGDFNTWLQGLRLTPGKVLVQEQIKRLEETIAKRSKSGK